MLLSEDVAGLLATVAAEVGSNVVAYRPHQIVCKLDHSLTVAYEVEFEGDQSGVRLVVAQAGGKLPTTGAVIATDGSTRIALWIYPNDPWLPGLAYLFDPDRLGRLLEQLGVSDAATPVEARSYRPGRRAVVEIATPPHRMFAKVVRPHRVADLQSLHRAMAGLPVPRSVGWSPEAGLVILDALEGVALSAAGAEQLDPTALSALLDRLPGWPRPVVSPVTRAAEHARLLSLISPPNAGLLSEVVGALQKTSVGVEVPVHGDLHAGQILVGPDGQLALVDIDSAGLGQRADDLAGLLAHVEAIAGDGSQLWSAWDSAELRLRAAAALLGFASGPFVAQQDGWPTEVARRIATAAVWAGV